ncbi:amidohydrolase family protein [Gangjinia marincola]|uniref:Amidohydrolase family protein n=1 Tax=Gangjinia marincola TaxID=578463 RepID=A0ABN1MIN8_9FLAO
MLRNVLSAALLFFGIVASAQEYFPKNDGVKASQTVYTVFKNVSIHTTPGKTIKNGMLLIKDGKVVDVGKSFSVPKNAMSVDLAGKEIYPSFVDIYSHFGIEKPKSEGGSPFGGNPQYGSSREGYYWNDHIRPTNDPLEEFKFDKKSADAMIKAGFGAVVTHVPDGIVRGTGMVVALNEKGNNGDRILKTNVAQYNSFQKSARSKQLYPTSRMGAMALLRQLNHDATWYAGGNAENKDLTLEAYNKNKSLPQIFDAGGLLDDMRADKVGDQFGIQYIIVGGGDEYQRIKDIKATGATYILPIDFQETYDVSDPYLTDYVSLEDMKHWQQGPTNPAMFAKNEIPFVLTTNGLKSPKEFKGNLMKAVKHGLSKEDALAALTTVPAQLIGMQNSLGTLKKGALANFMITSGDLFEKDTKVYEHWVQGNKTVITDMNAVDLTGKYTLNVQGQQYDLAITGDASKPKAEVTQGDLKLGGKVSLNNDWMNLVMTSADTTKKEFVRLIAKIPANPKNFSGKAVLPNGTETSFTATQKPEEDKEKDDEKKKKDEKKLDMLPITYPNNAYGYEKLPQQQDMLFKNVTVWTNEAEGILEQTDVLVKDGKIAKIGKNLSAGRATVIDGTGKHLTPGIVDEHSHIAASAINEAGHNNTAEVRMKDVVDPTDVDIYRNLAGGVTSIQLLHGSANPVGGRSAILKLKWGSSAEEMINKDAPGFIKFALGENVKQANWNSYSRFPQTRMGVEQVFVDAFTRAKEYEAKKATGNYRMDEELETMLEIINSERFVSCHSYVQSEINMLMKVAERFGFNINTFTHILEGYKVADKMAAHGAGGSTFSDWWAYKYEVKDAIPYNAAIMHNAGVVTAINSDDAEMSRRLNQEAAKSVKYGGISEEDALKFVTLNPAKLLHIDDKVGSVKVGKDADLVLWSGHPLHVATKAEKTVIEGKLYFDIENDAKQRAKIKQQRNQLIAAMLQEKNAGLKTVPVKGKDKMRFHCDSVETHDVFKK